MSNTLWNKRLVLLCRKSCAPCQDPSCRDYLSAASEEEANSPKNIPVHYTFQETSELSYALDEIGIFLELLSLPLVGGPREVKRFNANRRPISPANFHASSRQIIVKGISRNSRHVRESMTVLDSGFHPVDSGSEYWIPIFFCFNAFLRISFSCSNLAILKDVV